MISLMNLEAISSTSKPVTSSEYTVGIKSNEFHPEGLFSEVIFGAKETKERRTSYSFINLNCKVLHPALVKPMYQINRKVLDVLQRKASYRLENGTMVLDEDGEINGVTSIIKNFDNLIGREETAKIRVDMQKMLRYYMKKNMVFIDKCLVIPAFFREAQYDDASGTLRIDTMNEYYQKITRLSIQIQSLSMEPGTPLYEIHASKMFQLINELYDFLISKISKKQGMIRQNILGKRVDFSGRAVIIGGSSEVKVDEIGIPYTMLVKLFEPFILHDLYNSKNADRVKLAALLMEYNKSSLSVLTLRQLLSDINKDHDIPHQLDMMIRDSVNRVIANRTVMAKRDPCLHAESICGFKPVLVEGNSVKLAVANCSAYNADFDGDTMALFVPLSDEADEEVRTKMISSQSSDGITKIKDDLSKDFAIGIFQLTRDNPQFKNTEPVIIKNVDEIAKLHPNHPIMIDGHVTTAGRYIFNSIVPSDKYKTTKGLNKDNINDMMTSINNEYENTNNEVYVKFCDDLVKLGSKYYTLMPSTFSLDDLDVPQSILALKEKLKGSTPEQADLIIKKMEKMLQEHLESNGLNLGVLGQAKGLKGGYNQLRQILICKGLVQGPSNSVSVLPDSYSDGMTDYDFFNSGYASRSGIIDRVLNTADTGYLSRKLVCALQRVEGDPSVVDCKTPHYLTLKVTKDIAKRLVGRYVYDENNRLELFNAAKYTDKIVKLRSPIYCKSKRICATCYGKLLQRNRTPYVGVVAGQILGERLSQSIMRQFHVGGSVDMKLVDIMLQIRNTTDEKYLGLVGRDYKVTGTTLASTADNKGFITIRKEYYEDKKDLYKHGNSLHMTYGYFSINNGTYDIDITIDNMIEIPLDNKNVTETDEEFKIEFGGGQVVFVCVPTPQIFSKQVKIIDALFSGKQPFKTPDHFCMKVYELYGPNGMKCGADFVHFEVLSSNLLRDASNPAYPARLNPTHYKAKVYPLKSIPKLESWLQALAFEDPKQAITTGLLYNRPTDETILEKLISGEF